jgi:uncharacterized C2H2 Zn-finger protein
MSFSLYNLKDIPYDIYMTALMLNNLNLIVVVFQDVDDVTSLKLSMMTKTQSSDGKSCWMCTQCGKQHPNKSNIVQHVDQHIEGIQYRCDYCEKVFKSQGSLNGHVTLKHRNQRKLRMNITF